MIYNKIGPEGHQYMIHVKKTFLAVFPLDSLLKLPYISSHEIHRVNSPPFHSVRDGN